jgi:hypothetical protein
MLSERDETFLKKRTTLIRAWPFVGGVLLAALMALIAWLLWRSPFLFNPYALMQRMREGAIDQPMLQLMAGLLPVAMLSIFGLIGAMIALAFAAFSNEKRHLRILHELLEKEPGRSVRRQ